MKKYILIATILFSLLRASGSVYVKTSVNLRDKPSPSGNIVGIIEAGKTVRYDEIIYSYHYIEIIPGADKKSTSDHVGKTGWMWAARIKNNKVIIEGCTLRSSPEYFNNGTPNDTADDPNFIAKIKKGATIKILKSIESWYVIDGNYFSAICEK